MKFLIAGLGSIGRRHLRNLLALGEHDILLYRTFNSTLPDEELAGFPVERDLRAALAHHPDAVIVSNPTSLHMDVAIASADAGCHLLLEKPVSHSLKRVDDLRAAVKRNAVQVLVGYQFRFHPGLRQVSSFIANQAIGKLLSVRAHWGEYLPGWHPWEDYRQSYSARRDLGGGVILTLSHPLDYLLWLIGSVESTWAFTLQKSPGTFGSSPGNSALELEVEHTAEIGLRFTNGVIGSVHLDYNQQPPDHHLQIIGTHGTIVWNAKYTEPRIYRSGDDLHSEYEREPRPGNFWGEPETSLPFERNDMFINEMRHFLEIISHAILPLCTLDDGIQALKLALAVRGSAKSGRQTTLRG